jgi:hypothetical protein
MELLHSMQQIASSHKVFDMYFGGIRVEPQWGSGYTEFVSFFSHSSQMLQ